MHKHKTILQELFASRPTIRLTEPLHRIVHQRSVLMVTFLCTFFKQYGIIDSLFAQFWQHGICYGREQFIGGSLISVWYEGRQVTGTAEIYNKMIFTRWVCGVRTYLCSSTFSNVTFGDGKSLGKPAGELKSVIQVKSAKWWLHTPFVVGDCEDSLRSNFIDTITGNTLIKRFIGHLQICYFQNGFVDTMLGFLQL